MGTFVLAMTGLLDGKIATTNWLFIRNFKAQFPKVNLKPERILTDDLGLICTGAVTSAMNLALYLKMAITILLFILNKLKH